MRLERPLRTRFRYGSPTRVNLATQRKLAGSFFKRHAVTHPGHKRPVRLRRIVGERFQVLFHSPPGVLFTIPSRYYPLSVTREYLGLAGGPARFTRNFRGSVLLGVTSQSHRLTCTGVSPSTPGFSNPFPLQRWFLTLCRLGRTDSTAPQPRMRNACRLSHANGLASSDFARHYSRNHFCFLFLWVLRCFTSPRSLQLPYVFRQR